MDNATAVCERMVFVIEPSGDHRRQLIHMLQALEHHYVYTANDPECALNTVEKKYFDVVFCSYAISGSINGVQLLEKIMLISEFPPTRLVLVDKKPIWDLKIAGRKMAQMLQRPFTISDVQRVLPYSTRKPGDFCKKRA